MLNLSRLARCFIVDVCANVAVMFAVAMLPLALMVGAGVDYARVIAAQAELQSAIDAATLAFATADSNGLVIASNTFDANMRSKGGASASFMTQGDSSIGSATMSLETSFMKLAGFQTVAIRRTATVTRHKSPAVMQACVLLTDKLKASALDINGSITVDAPTCEFDIASTSTTAFNVYGSGNFNVSTICDAGGFNLYGTYQPLVAGTWTPSNVKTGCTPASDTLGNSIPDVSVAATPSAGGRPACTSGYNNATLSNGRSISNVTFCGTTTFDGTGSVILSNVTFNGPVTFKGSVIVTASNQFAAYDVINLNDYAKVAVMGDATWHGKIAMNGSSQLTLNSGLHVFKDELRFNGSHQLRGTDVSLYFANAAASFTGTGSVDMALSAPTSGRYANLLMFESPCECSPSTFMMTGSALEAKKGLIYLPCRDMTYVGATSTRNDEVALVLKSLRMTGSFRWALTRPGFLNAFGVANGQAWLTN